MEKPEVGIPPYAGRGKRPTKPKVLSDYKPISLSKLEKSDQLKWQFVNLGEGSKGPLFAQVACIRVFPSRDGLPQTDPVWLIIRKRTDGQIRYAFSNAPETISFEELCRASCLRWSIERCFQEGKMHLGMDHYEHRSWPAWHRHMIYVKPIIKIKPPIWFAFLSVFFVVTMSAYFNMRPLSRLEYE
nr:hypothetical protein [uncultured Desulfobacter sp.]